MNNSSCQNRRYRRCSVTAKTKANKGKVLEVSPKEDKVIVEGINVVTKHVKPRQMGETGRHREGGRLPCMPAR